MAKVVFTCSGCGMPNLIAGLDFLGSKPLICACGTQACLTESEKLRLLASSVQRAVDADAAKLDRGLFLRGRRGVRSLRLH